MLPARLFILPAVLAVLATAAVPASAVELPRCWEIPGTIQNAFGQPLGGATITAAKPCQGRPSSVVTDGNGAYLLPVEGGVLTASSDATATKPGFVPLTQRVGADLTPSSGTGNSASANNALEPRYQNQDFTMFYQLTAQLSVDAVQPGGVVEISAATSAPPLSSSSVPKARTIANLPDGTRLELAEVGSSGLMSLWEGTFTVPADAMNQVQEVSVCAVATTHTGGCAAGSPRRVTPVVELPFVVDGTSPMIPPDGLVPLDRGMTIFPTDQRLAARLGDSRGAGVEVSSVHLRLFSETAGLVLDLDHTSLDFDPTTGWVTSPPIGTLLSGGLTVNERYRLELSAADVAGNLATHAQSPFASGGGFLVGEALDLAQTSDTTAAIPLTECRVESVSAIESVAICENVALEFAATTVTLDNSAHAGQGAIRQSVGLDGALVHPRIGNAALPAMNAMRAGDPAWVPRRSEMGFSTDTAFMDVRSLVVAGRTEAIGTLTTSVPPGTTGASLSMGATDTAPSLVGTCADSRAGQDAGVCGPDPLSLYTAVRFDPPLTPAELESTMDLPLPAGSSLMYNVALVPARTEAPFAAGVSTGVQPEAARQLIDDRLHSSIAGLASSLTAAMPSSPKAAYLDGLAEVVDIFEVTSIDIGAEFHPDEVVEALLDSHGTRAQPVPDSRDYFLNVDCPRVLCEPLEGLGGAQPQTGFGKPAPEWAPEYVEHDWEWRYEEFFMGDMADVYAFDMWLTWSDWSQLDLYRDSNDAFEINLEFGKDGRYDGSDSSPYDWQSDLPEAYEERVKFDDDTTIYGIGSDQANDIRPAEPWIARIEIIDRSYRYDTLPAHRIPAVRHYTQYDLDPKFGGCGDACFYDDGAADLTNLRTFPYSYTRSRSSGVGYGGGG